MRCTLQLTHLLHHLPCPQLMHMPVKEARAHLGISKESFRALVQGHGLKRWPQRQLSALDNLLDWVREDAKMAGTGQLEVRHAPHLACGSVLLGMGVVPAEPALIWCLACRP